MWRITSPGPWCLPVLHAQTQMSCQHTRQSCILQLSDPIEVCMLGKKLWRCQQQPWPPCLESWGTLWKLVVYKNNHKKNPKFSMLTLTISPSTHLWQLMIKISFYYHNLTSRGATPCPFTDVLWELSGIAGNLPELKELHLNMRKRGGEKNTVSRLDTVIWSTQGTKDIKIELKLKFDEAMT